MRTIVLSACAAALVVAAIAFAQSRMYPEQEAINKSRAQIPVAGAPDDVLAPTDASDSTATGLSSNAVYMFTCSQDAHIRWANNGGTCTAVATDFLLTSGTIIYFATGPQGEANMVCAIRNAVNGYCYIKEVR